MLNVHDQNRNQVLRSAFVFLNVVALGMFPLQWALLAGANVMVLTAYLALNLYGALHNMQLPSHRNTQMNQWQFFWNAHSQHKRAQFQWFLVLSVVLLVATIAAFALQYYTAGLFSLGLFFLSANGMDCLDEKNYFLYALS